VPTIFTFIFLKKNKTALVLNVYTIDTKETQPEEFFSTSFVIFTDLKFTTISILRLKLNIIRAIRPKLIAFCISSIINISREFNRSLLKCIKFKLSFFTESKMLLWTVFLNLLNICSLNIKGIFFLLLFCKYFVIDNLCF